MPDIKCPNCGSLGWFNWVGTASIQGGCIETDDGELSYPVIDDVNVSDSEKLECQECEHYGEVIEFKNAARGGGG